MMLTSANSGSIAAPTPPTIATPQLQAPPTPLQAPPTDSMDCSTSPTNTSGSDVSALSSSDLAAILAVSQQAAIKQEFMHQQVKQELPPMANPIFTMPDAAASLLQFIQAQQAVAQFHAQAAQHRVVLQQQQQHNPPQERKRSYPCTFQFCVICQKDVHSSKLPCHIRQCHVAKPMFQCPACDFTSTYSKNNVKSHMVSLHGLAGDPISYMDKYAAQVDEYMKMCFPNVRGRGRPMQGRTSPRSPASPQQLAGRRNSQNGIPRRPSVHQQEMIALAAQQQQHALLAAAQGISPLSIFPQIISNNNNNNMSTNQDRKISCQPQKHDSLESVDNGVSSSGSTDDMRNNHPRVRSTSSWSLVMLPQPSRPTENQPRYLVRNIGNFVLDDQQTKDTIFDGIPNELEADDHMSNESRLEYPLLTEEQHQLVSDVIKEIHLKKFEVEFSIHSISRMDLKVLPLERAALVLSVTPSATDVSRIKNFVENHPDFKWTEEEQFIIDLAKIERAEEKLKVMIHNATFDDEIQKINTELDNFSSAAKAVQSSENFRSILELVLGYINLVNGSNSRLRIIKGFTSSHLSEICSCPVSPDSTILHLLAMQIRNSVPHVLDIFDLLEVLKKASEVPFLDIFSSIGRLIDGNNRMQRELELLSFDHDQLTQRLLADCRQVEETMDKLMRVKDDLCAFLHYMGETLPRLDGDFHPELFFFKVYDFLTSLKVLTSQDPVVNASE